MYEGMHHTCCSLLHVLSAWRLAFCESIGEDENMAMHLLTVYSLWFDWAVLSVLGFLILEVSLSDVC